MRRWGVPAWVAALLVLVVLTGTAGSLRADTREWTFDQLDQQEWKTVNCTPQVLPDGGGLKIHVDPSQNNWVGLEGASSWADMFDIRLEYQLLDAPDNTHVYLRLSNPQQDRRVDLWQELRWVKNDAGQTVASSYGHLESFHGDQRIGDQGSHHYAMTNSLRFLKEGRDLYGYQSAGGDWRTVDYPRRNMGYDVDEYRIGVFVSAPSNAKPFDVVIKRVWAWDSVYRAVDRKLEEETYTRAAGEEVKNPKIWRFDFGPVGQQLEDKHLPISQFTMYDSRRGWGWKTDLEPISSADRIPYLRNEEAVKLGLEPTPNLSYWRGNVDMQLNYSVAHKKRWLTAVSHGGDYVQFYKRWMDLKIACERDMVCARRPYGFPWNQAKEADQWERRAGIYADDDLSTEFVVDLPDGRYTLMVGVGYTSSGPGGASSFNIDAEGITVKKGLDDNWRRCNMYRLDDVEVRDGQLNLRLYADRRMAMNRVDVWELGVGWMINYLLVIPSDERDQIKAEQWRLINDRGRKVRQVVFVEGDPIYTRVQDNHLVVNEKPYFPVIWQAFHNDSQEHYPYYLWGNLMGTIEVSWQFRGSSHFMQDDWVGLSAADDYPWMTVNQLNLAYVWGSNSLMRTDGLLSFMPQAIAGEGGSLQDARGRSDRWDAQPPLNSRLHREIQREAYTMATQQLKLHPDLIGHYMYEEYWHPRGQGYDFQSLQQFHQWLAQKYTTISALNAEWGSDYKSFDDIKPPADAVANACWANFRRFRMYAQEQSINYPVGLLAELDPNRTTFGAKGDYATASWYYAKDVQLFGWYSINHSRSAAYHFGQVPICGGGLFNCPWGWDDGRKQLDHKPAYPKKYRDKDADNAYSRFMRDIFRGSRGFYCEEYDDGIQHMFHRTRYIDTASKAGRIRMWYGALAQFDDPAFVGPDVFIDEGPLRFSRFMAWAYRNAPLWLSAKVPQAPVAILSTDESYFEIPGSGEIFSTSDVEALMDRIEMPVDILRSGRFDDYSQYKVIIVGTFSEMLTPYQAEKLKEFVKAGGKVLWLTNGGFRSGIDLKPDKERPRFELTALTGCQFKDAKEVGIKGGQPLMLVPNKLTPSITQELQIGQTDPSGLVLVPTEGCTLLARGEDQAYAVVSPDRSVVTLNFSLGPPQWQNWEEAQQKRLEHQQKLTAFFHDILFDLLAADPGYRIEGAKDPDNLDFAILNGDGYSLFALINQGRQEDEATVKPSLTPGRYELVDLTGCRPIVVKDAAGANKLDPDPEGLYVKVLAKDIGADELMRQGLKLSVGPMMARVILARPAGTAVLVDSRDYTIKSRCSKPVIVVVGDQASGEEQASAERIRKFLADREVPVELVKASQVKTEKTRHAVDVNPMTGRLDREKDSWFVVDVFDNQPIDTDRHMICVGSEETNAVVRHLGAPNTFVYDKVPEKVTAAYPGPGRGVIQMVDSVNFPFYQANGATRDAILVGGSDAAGTVKATDRFLELVKDLPKYVPPKAEKRMEIDARPDQNVNR